MTAIRSNLVDVACLLTSVCELLHDLALHVAFGEFDLGLHPPVGRSTLLSPVFQFTWSDPMAEQFNSTLLAVKLRETFSIRDTW